MSAKKTTAKKPVAKKEVKHITPELIAAVLSGEYGDENERKIALTAKGYSPSAVTKKINDLKKLNEELKPIAAKAGEYFGCLLMLE